MSRDDRIEELLKASRYQGGPGAHDRILGRAYEAMDEMKEPGSDSVRPGVRRITMKSRSMRIAAIAAAILIVLGGVTFWPFGSAGKSQWWQGPSAAWGQGVLDSLDRVEAVVYRQQGGFAGDYGPAEMSVGWERRYNAKDRYRRDRYDDGKHIMNTQWVIADGNDVTMTEVSYQYECFFQQENERYGFIEDFLGQMRQYVGLLDRADRILDPQVFDGRECVGFEISEAKYGDNPQGRFDRIWFDVETRLPARIEWHGIPLSFDSGRTLVIIHDQFEYYAQVPADLFVPTIPDGFVNAHPDEIQAQRNAAVKGEMVFAEVPEGLKEKVVSALKAVEAGGYRDGSDLVWFSKDAWRRDRYSDAGLAESHWYVPSAPLSAGPFELQGDATVTETIVNYEKGTYQVGTHAGSWTPSHPMRRILFVAGLIDKADRLYDDAEIDGVTCFGFDVSAKKYGDNPDGMLHHVWFDAATNLPVQMELVWPPSEETEAHTAVKDQFAWNPDLPADLFAPHIPDGFRPASD